MTVSIFVGSCLSILPSLPERTVDCCVTSPPYFGLRDYGVDSQLGLEPTPDEYVANMVAVFREVRRVLRDDGTLWINIGDSYASSGIRNWHPQQIDKSKASVRGGGNKIAGMEYVGGKLEHGCKPKDLIGIPWLLAFALRADGWYLRSEIIWHKCLSGGTRVYARTAKGDAPMTVKDLVRIDPSTVKLWNGEKWTQAVAWSQTARPDESFEIELRSGERIGCTANHVWPTQRGNVRADDLRVGDIVQTCRLPEPEKCVTPDCIPDDLGWFIGLYLAEGSRCKGGKAIQIASHIKEGERFARLDRIATDYGGRCRVYRLAGKTATAVIHSPVLSAIIDEYLVNGTAKNKRLTRKAWQRSNAFLRSLIEGYLHGDGHYDKTNDRYRLGFTDNVGLAEDLRTLAARLGAHISLRTSYSSMAGRYFPSYKGEWRWHVSDHHNTRDRGQIVAIRSSRARQFWDISVADDPHLFALASGVLTHNSNPMPESVRDRPTKAHEQIFLLSKSERYYYDADAIRSPLKEGADHDRLVVAHASAGNGRAHSSKTSSVDGDVHMMRSNPKGANKRSVWTVATRPYKGAHFATYPPELIEPCIKAGSREGGVILDPFFGAGTTGLVANRLGRDCIGIELNEEYAEIARKRIEADNPMFSSVTVSHGKAA